MEPRIKQLLSSDRFCIGNICFYWPRFGHYISVHARDGGSVHLLTIDEAINLVTQLSNT